MEKIIKNLNVRLPINIIRKAKAIAYAEGKTLEKWVEEIISEKEFPSVLSFENPKNKEEIHD